MHLTKGALRVELDPSTGSVLKVEDVRARWAYFDRTERGAPSCPLFRLMAPTPAWPGRHADSDASGAPRVERRNGGYELRYPDLRINGRRTGLETAVAIAPSPRADEICFRLRVRNRSPFPVNEVQFPRIAGWRGRDGPGKDTLIAGAV